MAVDLSGKVRTLLDLPVGLTLQDIAEDGRSLFRLIPGVWKWGLRRWAAIRT